VLEFKLEDDLTHVETEENAIPERSPVKTLKNMLENPKSEVGEARMGNRKNRVGSKIPERSCKSMEEKLVLASKVQKR